MATAVTRTGTSASVEGSSLASGRHSLPPQSRPALESAVDAYATRVLRMKSPPESCVDDSLGPYVTSIIRCSLGESSHGDGGGDGHGPDAVDVYDMDVEDMIEDYESLVELLEGHCGMSPDVAKSALHSIAISVRTGVVDAFGDDGGCGIRAEQQARQQMPQQQQQLAVGSLHSSSGILGTSLGSIISFDGSHGGGRLGRSFRSKSVGADNDHEGMDAVQMLGDMLRDTDIGGRSGHGLGIGISETEDFGVSRVEERDDIGLEQPYFVMDEDIPLDRAAQGNGGKLQHNFTVPSVSALSTPQQSSGSASPDQVVNVCANGMSNGAPAFTPTKLDRLIPVDLMGVLDNPATPAPPQQEGSSGEEKAAVHFPDAPDLEDAQDRLPKKGRGKKKSKAKAQDLAAALFRPSRARSNSMPHDKSPKLKPLSGAAPPPAMLSSAPPLLVQPDLFQQQLTSITQILLSMNGSLGEEAATEAALVSNFDVNVAQYVIDGVMAAPPVCRHMLHGGCYRSDCHFSHDVEGNTCLFWLRGRCGKGGACRFMHGFGEKLLEGIQKDFLPENHHSELSLYSPVAAEAMQGSGGGDNAFIQTANLVQHNMSLSSSVPKHGGQPFLFQEMHPADGATLGWSAQPPLLPTQRQAPVAPTPSPPPPSSSRLSPMNATLDGRLHPEPPAPKPNESGGGHASSAWSRVAQQGYSSKTSFSHDEPETHDLPPPAKGRSKTKAARIPQNLWNPSERRSATAFHIADPIQRYAEVSATHPRRDVVDLHFQSTKTFPVVLSRVLPVKLAEHGEVWVVTGSGHHAARNSHQKGGGVLEGVVLSWLDEHGYEYLRGKDRNGYCGAVLVKR